MNVGAGRRELRRAEAVERMAEGIDAIAVDFGDGAGRAQLEVAAHQRDADRIAGPQPRGRDSARCLRDLQQLGVWIYGLAGEAGASLYDTDLRGNVALVLGGEGDGMRRLTREHCDGLVKIPMPGDIESLNVSVATGITLFEAVRQRR